MLRLGALLRLSAVAQPAKATKKKAAKENQARGKCGKSAKKAAPQKHAQPQKVPMSIQVSDDDASTEADPSGVEGARCEQVQHVCAAVLSIADIRLQGRTCIQDLRCFHASYNLHMCIERHMSASVDTTLLTLGWCAVTAAPLSAY